MEHGLDLIIVDYLQLITVGDGNGQKNRVQEVSGDHRRPEGPGQGTDVPIIALSQLSRQVEHREDKRPQLSDLRESGSIEQDADCVMFVYPREYYLPRRTEGRHAEHATGRTRWTSNGPGRGHHRQAASRPDRHRQAELRRQFTRFSDAAEESHLPYRTTD